MNGLVRFFRFNFIPRSADLGLLVLRVWLGLTLLFNHGWGKLMNFSAMSEKFADPFGLGMKVSLGLATFAEVVCAALLVIGFLTRFATLVLVINMATAFWFAHNMKLSGPGNGELPFLYLAGFVTLFLAGAGRFSVDGKTNKA